MDNPTDPPRHAFAAVSRVTLQRPDGPATAQPFAARALDLVRGRVRPRHSHGLDPEHTRRRRRTAGPPRRGRGLGRHPLPQRGREHRGVRAPVARGDRARRACTARSSSPTTARTTAAPRSPPPPARASSTSRAAATARPTSRGFAAARGRVHRHARRRPDVPLRRDPALRRGAARRAPSSSWATGWTTSSPARCTGSTATSATRCSAARSTSSSAPASATRTAACAACGATSCRRSTCARPAWSSPRRWSSARRRRSSTSASSRSPTRRAAARRSSRAGATAGGTCASCSSTARRTSSSSPAPRCSLLGALITLISLSQIAILGRQWNLHTTVAGELLVHRRHADRRARPVRARLRDVLHGREGPVV